MKNKAVVIKRAVLTALTLAVVAYIFINSSFDAVTSDSQSLGVRKMINDFLHSLNINITLTDYFVRKTAHFVEYFALGTLLFFTIKSYVCTINIKMITAAVIGLVVASVDETIQLFSYGRSAQVSDVILDFMGVCTAVLIFIFLYKICNKHKDKEVKND